MKSITRDMIKIYNIKKIGYDFMGYTFDNTNQLSFHHLVVPKKDCSAQGLGKGYLLWNGAILTQSNKSSSHDYLHTIEMYDRDVFLLITKYMIEENNNGKIDLESLRRIRDALEYFEKENCSTRTRDGKLILKKSFIQPRIKL